MNQFLKIQPASCRIPLVRKALVYSDWVMTEHPEYIQRWERVLFFDPSLIYSRIHEKLNPNKRIHSIPIEDMFPPIDGFCSCGCGSKLEGRQRRWATDDCSRFAWDVRAIICNTHQRPTFYINKYFGDGCMECREAKGEELDHIIGVKHGGGGCWLSNYKWVCKKCHREKTNKDFGYKKKNEKKN